MSHLRSLFNPPAAAAPTPPPPRPRAVPLQPGTLESLELDLGRGWVGPKPPNLDVNLNTRVSADDVFATFPQTFFILKNFRTLF